MLTISNVRNNVERLACWQAGTAVVQPLHNTGACLSLARSSPDMRVMTDIQAAITFISGLLLMPIGKPAIG